MKSSACVNCSEKIEGRLDKIFCSPYCKSAYHYQKSKLKEKTMFKTIDEALKRNRGHLAHYNTAGKAVIRKEELLKAGFDPCTSRTTGKILRVMFIYSVRIMAS